VPIFAALLFLAASTTFDESYRAGLQALQQNRLAEAKTNLEQAATLQPANSRVWLALAQTYWKLQESAKAGETADRALKLANDDAQVLRLLAVFYSQSGQAVKSCDVQARLAAAAPDQRDALPGAMRCYLDAHVPERAVTIGSGNPGREDRADIRDLLGKANSAMKKWDAAAAEFQASIRLNPYEESYYFDLANCLLQQEKFEPAIKVLQDGRRKFDKSAQIELALGVAYYGLRRFPEAATAFQHTIALAPDIEQPYLFLGKMLDQIPAKVPELTLLFDAFEKAHPQNYAGYLLHAKALLAQSTSPELTEQLLKEACALNTVIPEPHLQLGILFERQQRFAEAAGEFESAARLDPADPVTHYHLARVYDRLGKHDAAVSERERHKHLLETSASPAAASMK
jgi:tetratricopeptide (TPR) repeat protein